MRSGWNVSHTTCMSSILARWQAKIISFVLAFFQLTCCAVSCSSPVQKVEAAVVLQGLSIPNFEHLSSSIVKLTAWFEITPYRREERAKQELDLAPAFLPREGAHTVQQGDSVFCRNNIESRKGRRQRLGGSSWGPRALNERY